MKLSKHFNKIWYTIVVVIWVFNIGMCVYGKYSKCKTVTVHFQDINELLKKDPDNAYLLQTKAELEKWAETLRPMIESNIKAQQE